MSFEVDFEPVGRRAPAEKGETILAAAQNTGIVLNATCGGEGVCSHCVVRVTTGLVSPPNLTEEADLGPDRTAEGWRLACQAEVQGDVRIHIPPDTLATAQRIQTEGRALPIELDPAVRAVEVELPPPSLDDLRSDAARLRDALNMPELIVPAPVLRTLSGNLRANDFHVAVFLRGASVVGVYPPGTAALGLAVDVGTTKLAGYLIDLASGQTLATAGVMNPQIAFGEDVMSRLGHAISKPDGGSQLQAAAVDALNRLAADLCAQAGRLPRHIADAVVVGNTAIHHLLLGLPVRQLALAPYVAAESSALDLPARDVGLTLSPAASVHLLPNIAGFVGADHVAMLLASGGREQDGVTLCIDIGTNTEISLITPDIHLACSAASGPAFEGAHIQHGMRAAPGSIEKVVIQDGAAIYQTIDGEPPVGLCGSGILDLVAQLRKARIVNKRGAFIDPNGNSHIRQGGHGPEYVVVDGEDNRGRAITFSRSDVNEIQLAKGAIRAGVQILLRRAGLAEEDLATVIVAGAFGTYLDVQSGIDIGLFPQIDKERFVQVGNAAGTGARMALLSLAKRKQAVDLAQGVTYVELTTEKEFARVFARALEI